MVVQHNLQAMNANRMLGITTQSTAKSTEKLSSGYKINRAADNAAGLAISEKMRKQIRGLDQASANAEDGISSVQTAEGALTEVQDMLQRMNELCVQAANGTNSVTDRKYIQDELDQLVTEIDRVAETTKFNDTYLLKGDDTAVKTQAYITNYSFDKTKNIVNNVEKQSNYKPLDYKINYKGTNNIYMVSTDILTSNKNQPQGADKIQTGDDITEYFYKSSAPSLEMNDAEAALNVSKYQAFVNVELDSRVTTGENGVVRGEMPHDADKTYDLSTDGTSSIVRANQVLYMYDTKTETVTRLQAGSEMTEYLNDDNTVQERYRLVDILDGSEEKFAQYKGNEDATATNVLNKETQAPSILKDEIYGYTGIGHRYYSNGTTTVSRTVYLYEDKGSLEYNTNIYDTYYKADQVNQNWGFSKTDKVPTDYLDTTGNNINLGTSLRLVAKQEATGDVENYVLAGEVIELTTSISKADFQTKYGLEFNDTNFEVISIQGLAMDAEGNNVEVDLQELVSLSGSSDKVSKQILGGENTSDPTKRANWMWDNNNIEIDESLQKLYDANGQIVSGVALNKFFDKHGNYMGGLYTTDQARAIDRVFSDKAVGTDEYENIKDLSGQKPALITDYITQSFTEVSGDLEFTLHVGADSDRDNKIEVSIYSLTSAGLGIDKIHSNNIGIVDETGDNATDAIDVVAEALRRVSTQRSMLGAVQNRLEHTINNLDNVVENTTAAESQIRDTDMADEMVSYSNQNVLQQAGQSMLAQANQANQGVLSLIQ